MFASIADAIEAYKAELRRYKEWNDKMMKKAEEHKGVNIPAEYSTWPDRLEGMQQALGLTRDEIHRIDAEVGFVRNPSIF